jgi:hypothetical protein
VVSLQPVASLQSLTVAEPAAVAELAIACALLPVEISAPGTAPASRRYLSVRGRLSVRFFAALILCTQFSFFTVPRGRVNCEVRVSYFLRALVRVSSPNVNYIQTEAFRDSRSIVKLHSRAGMNGMFSAKTSDRLR